MNGNISSLPSEPPRLFKRGPSPLARLTFFGLISVGLMFIDVSYRTLDSMRLALDAVVYPAQQIALVPSETMNKMSAMFQSQTELRKDNEALKAQVLKLSQAAQAQTATSIEAERLSKLLHISTITPTKSQASRVVYLGRDPFSQKAFINRDVTNTFEAGAAVIDENGLLGQVTRLHPLLAEITLLSEKDFSVPVKIERTGLRALLYGRGPGRLPEIRFVTNEADIKEGDVVLTSSIDGVYPANIRVGSIRSAKRDPSSAFARVECLPAASIPGVDGVLVLDKPPAPPARPQPEASENTNLRNKRR